MKIVSNNKTINIIDCKSFKSKLIGFMFNKNILNYGLHFKCSSIHTFFCFQNLDIIMTDKFNNVLYIYKDVKPNKILIKKNVYHVYEFSSNIIDLNNFELKKD